MNFQFASLRAHIFFQFAGSREAFYVTANVREN